MKVSKTLQNRLDKRKKVYVICGRNQALHKAMDTFLRALALQPIEREVAVDRTEETSPFVGSIIDAVFRNAQAIVVLFTGDDKVRLREELWNERDTDNEKMERFQPGADQIFEAGYAFGKAPNRTILVQVGDVKLFTDIEGRHIPNFTGSHSDLQALKTRLIRAGCEVEDKGSAWLDAVSDFQSALKPPSSHTS